MIPEPESVRRARRGSAAGALRLRAEGAHVGIRWPDAPPRRDVDVVEKRVEKLEERVSALEEARQT